MATRVVTVDNQTVPRMLIATWADLDASDDGAMVVTKFYPDKTVHVTGTGTATIQGSNDGTNWFTCHQIHDGAAAAIVAGTGAAIVENPLYIRPLMDAGASNAKVVLVCTSNV